MDYFINTFLNSYSQFQAFSHFWATWAVPKTMAMAILTSSFFYSRRTISTWSLESLPWFYLFRLWAKKVGYCDIFKLLTDNILNWESRCNCLFRGPFWKEGTLLLEILARLPSLGGGLVRLFWQSSDGCISTEMMLARLFCPLRGNQGWPFGLYDYEII